jgi:flavin reductase (DIM6/NTAB) family NADH-FMN oxidoreductase RutF
MPPDTPVLEGAAPEGLSFRRALGRYATGVAVVTTRTPEGELLGLTANSFAAVSLDPPLVLWSLRRSATTLEGFRRSGFFAVNVLAADQINIAKHFARSGTEKFRSVPFSLGVVGGPLIPGCLTTLECQVESTTEGGDHVIFIGRVLKASTREGEPLIFSGGQYCRRVLLPE